MTDTMGNVDRFGQPVPAEPGYVMFINEDGSQPRMRIRVHLDNTLAALDDSVSDATMLVARGMTVAVQGAPLPDSDSTISVVGGSEWTLSKATAPVTIMVLASGAVVNEAIVINVKRKNATPVTITDDSNNVITVIPPSIPMTVSVSFDGTHFGSAHMIRIET